MRQPSNVEQELAEYEARLLGLIPRERFSRVRIPRPEPDVIVGFLALEDLTSTISDVLDQLGIVGTVPAAVLQPILTGARVCGPAITLRYVPDRVSPAHGYASGARAKMADRDAYAIAHPGDVVVMDCGGVAVSNMGGMSSLWASMSKLAACVIDGGVRDAAGIRELSYPTWCRAVTPITGKYRIEAAEINGLIRLVDVQVAPGDLICADDTGVCVVPCEQIADVLKLAQEKDRAERRVTDMIRQGERIEDIKKVLSPDKW